MTNQTNQTHPAALALALVRRARNLDTRGAHVDLVALGFDPDEGKELALELVGNVLGAEYDLEALHGVEARIATCEASIAERACAATWPATKTPERRLATMADLVEHVTTPDTVEDGILDLASQGIAPVVIAAALVVDVAADGTWLKPEVATVYVAEVLRRAGLRRGDLARARFLGGS